MCIGICHTFLSNFTGALVILLVRAGKGWDELDEKSFWAFSHLQGCACAGGNLTFLECFLRWCWKWEMGNGIWDMGYGLWVMGYGIWDMGYGI